MTEYSPSQIRMYLLRFDLFVLDSLQYLNESMALETFPERNMEMKKLLNYIM